MFNFFIFSLCSLALVSVVGGNNNIHSNKQTNYSNYPSGYELKRQLRQTIIYDYDTTNLNYDLIEEYIFRDYVYNFEVNSGYCREVAIRKALDKYIKVYKILDVKI